MAKGAKLAGICGIYHAGQCISITNQLLCKYILLFIVLQAVNFTAAATVRPFVVAH